MSLLAILIAYLLGGIPFGYLLVRWKTGADVRAVGSGNIGATNVQRTAGTLAGVLTLVLDVLKGYAALWITARLSGNDPGWLSAAAVAVMLGHIYTPFLKFKGGKGVAPFTGAFLYLTPPALLAVAVVFVVSVAATRHISLGSIAGAISFPLAVWLIQQPTVWVFLASLICCALVLYRHRDNFTRLRAGDERVLTLQGRRR